MKTKIVLAVVLLAGLSAQVSAEILYHELFSGDGTGFPAVGWNYYVKYPGGSVYTSNGTDAWGGSYSGWNIGGPGPAGGANMDYPSVNSNPIGPDMDGNGYAYSGGGYMDGVYYNAEYTIDLSQWTDLVVSFMPDNDLGGAIYRVALAVAPTPGGTPTWYLSNLAFGGPNGFSTRTFINTTGSNWSSLNMSDMTPGAPAALPGGYAVGFGFHIVANSGGGNIRWDNFMVEGTVVPEPASVLLLTLGTLGLCHRRKKQG